MKHFMQKSIETALAEVEQPGETDDETVDCAEGSETEDFRGIVGYGGVVEGSVENEETHVAVGRPGVG